MNPLLQDWTAPFELPTFDDISDDDFAPAVEAALDQARANIAAIADNPAPPTFENTIDALELARNGTGIAMNDQLITSHWITTGELVAPFSQQVTAYDNYYLVTDPVAKMPEIVNEFETWLRQKIA